MRWGGRGAGSKRYVSPRRYASYSTHVIRQVGQRPPSRGVPQTKHWERGRGTIGTAPVVGSARSGSGGGGARGPSTSDAVGVPLAGGARASESSVGGAGPGAGFAAGAAEAPGEAFGDDVPAGSEGFFSGASDSLRRRRKNDIPGPEPLGEL